jgi:hypothetical protein
MALMVLPHGSMALSSVIWLGVVIILAAYANQILAKVSAWKHKKLLFAALGAGATAFTVNYMVIDWWGCVETFGWLCSFL